LFLQWKDAALSRHREHRWPMQLPGGNRAFVAPAKVRDYLLSPTHPTGQFKSQFFARLGFRRAAWPVLLRTLESIAAAGEAELATATRFGQKYVVRGTVQARAGRIVPIVTVWIVLTTEDFPRFITAYPEETTYEP
jgi:hypothetical protein